MPWRISLSAAREREGPPRPAETAAVASLRAAIQLRHTGRKAKHVPRVEPGSPHEDRADSPLGSSGNAREKLREVGCSRAEIEAITGTSRATIRRPRIAGRTCPAPAPASRVEETGGLEHPPFFGSSNLLILFLKYWEIV